MAAKTNKQVTAAARAQQRLDKQRNTIDELTKVIRGMLSGKRSELSMAVYGFVKSPEERVELWERLHDLIKSDYNDRLARLEREPGNFRGITSEASYLAEDLVWARSKLAEALEDVSKQEDPTP